MSVAASYGKTNLTDGFGSFWDRPYDNFTPDDIWLIRDFHWFGVYDLPIADPRQTITFTISFWNSRPDEFGGTEPDTSGAPLHEANILNDAMEMSAGTIISSAGDEVYIFEYRTDLPVPFLVQPGTELWASVVANIDAPGDNDPFAFWLQGDGPDDIAYQDSVESYTLSKDMLVLGDADNRLLKTDLAFAVTGDVIPEPASVFIWLILAAAGLCVTFNRKLHNLVVK